MFGKAGFRRKGAGKGGGQRRKGSRKGSGKGRKGAPSALICESDPSEGVAPAPRIDESELTSGQQAAAARALAGESLFLTGAAGTGKSFLLRYLVQEFELRYPEQVAVTASTGIAAANVGGQTIHSFAGVGLGTGSVRQLVNKVQRSSTVVQKWQSTRVLVIDEISMLDSNLFDALDAIGKAARKLQVPFGGLQVILCGDFLQLPPVQGRGEPAKSFCFQASAWKRNRLDAGTVVLTESVRQAGDPEFAKALNEIREGVVSPESEELFGACCVDVKAAPTDGIVPTKLYCLNVNVDRENSARLALLPGRATVLRARDHFKGVRDPGRRQQLSTVLDKKVSGQLELKVGAQVIMLKNKPELKLVNGSRGIVELFEAGRPVVRFDNGKSVHLGLERFTQGSSSTSLTRLQVPLKLGWAMTVHKAQGVTLSRAELQVDDAFEAGQSYVALSRLTCTAGLWIRGAGIQQANTHAHPDVLEFYRGAMSRQASVGPARARPAGVASLRQMPPDIANPSHERVFEKVDKAECKRQQPRNRKQEAKRSKTGTALDFQKLDNSPPFHGRQHALALRSTLEEAPIQVQARQGVQQPEQPLQWMHFGAPSLAQMQPLQPAVSTPQAFQQALPSQCTSADTRALSRDTSAAQSTSADTRALARMSVLHQRELKQHRALLQAQERSAQTPNDTMQRVPEVPDAAEVGVHAPGQISCKAETAGEVAASCVHWISPPKLWGGGVILLD